MNYRALSLISELLPRLFSLDEDGVFLGCTISAGVGISLEALAKKTSQLPAVRLTAPPTSIGTNTVDCMQSGTVFGTAAMLDGLTARMERDFGRKVKTTVATGGLAEEIVKNCDREIIFDRDLILEGLKNIYKRKFFKNESSFKGRKKREIDICGGFDRAYNCNESYAARLS